MRFCAKNDSNWPRIYRFIVCKGVKCHLKIFSLQNVIALIHNLQFSDTIQIRTSRHRLIVSCWSHFYVHNEWICLCKVITVFDHIVTTMNWEHFIWSSAWHSTQCHSCLIQTNTSTQNWWLQTGHRFND